MAAHIRQATARTMLPWSVRGCLPPRYSSFLMRSFVTSTSAHRINRLLLSLNPEQLKAVEHPEHVPLQVLAGPGTGKTKVLVARTVSLIHRRCIPPSSIVAVTFTNRAAMELRERLTHTLGRSVATLVRAGTFHSLCWSFLQQHGNSIGINANFTICNAEERKRALTKILGSIKRQSAAERITLRGLSQWISNQKLSGRSAADIMSKLPTGDSDLITGIEIAAGVYATYEQFLTSTNSLDFDDLLVLAVKLIKQHPEIVEWCNHVLVDEFQDTNTTQWTLARLLAEHHRGLTVVGDPDQSIYHWRGVDNLNFSKMRQDFAETEQIILVQNYRSTGSILMASQAIISQDSSRIPKALRAAHPRGQTPTLRLFASPTLEAQGIAAEIRRFIAKANGVIRWRDCAILVRYHALSRPIEIALTDGQIPYGVFKGDKFFDRMEVQDLLAYLQLIDNPDFTPAFQRIVNIPRRRVGKESLNDLLRMSDRLKLPPLKIVEHIVDLRMPEPRFGIANKLSEFVRVLRYLRQLVSESTPLDNLIRELVRSIGYKDHLRKTQLDCDDRLINVEEIVCYAKEFEEALNNKESPGGSISRDTPLRLFLQSCALRSEDSPLGAHENKVTIATCHAAKGLEWPVVFIPAVETDVFPLNMSSEVEAEDRRVLYVGCTRAQCLLYLSHTTARRMSWDSELSPYISSLPEEERALFSDQLPDLSPANISQMAQMLGRLTGPMEGDS